MKKNILLVTILCLFAIQLSAQQKPFRFGVKVAPNIAWITPDTEGYANDGASMGFSWGFIADITLMDNYFIRTGFNFDYLNSNLKLPYDSISPELTGGTVARKYKFRYLEVPVVLKMRTNQFGKFAFYGNIGFGASFNLKSKSKDEYINQADGYTTSKDGEISDELCLMRATLIVGGGVEYFIDESTSLTFDITYNNGLSNIFKGDNPWNDLEQKGNLNCVQLNIGVLF